MQMVWRKRVLRTKILWGNLLEDGHLEDWGRYQRMSKTMFRRVDFEDANWIKMAYEEVEYEDFVVTAIDHFVL